MNVKNHLIYSRVPIGRNVFPACETKADSLLLIPQPRFADKNLCPAISVGTEHWIFPLLHPTLYVFGCRGHTVSDA